MADAIVTTHPDKDGVTVTESRLRKQKSSVTTSETITGGLWKKVQYVEPDTGLVGWELTTTRSVTGVAIVSTRIDPDGVVVTREETFAQLSTITASEVLAGSNIVKTFAEAISDLVGWKVVETRAVFANKSSTTEVNDPVPEEFKGVIPAYRTQETVTGAIVDPPVLSAGDLQKTEEQISTLLKRVIKFTRAGITFPVTFTNKEVTTQYGGGILDVILTLDDSALTADEGKLVVRSKVIVTGGGSLWLKETAKLPSGDWPELEGTEVDEHLSIVIPYTTQVVAAGTTGGVSGFDQTEVRPLDYERSQKTTRSLPSDLSTLNREYNVVVNHAFPDTLLSASLENVFADNGEGVVELDFGLRYKLARGYRGPCDGRIEELYTHGPPSAGDLPTITKFFPQEQQILVWGWHAASPGNVWARFWTFNIPYSLHDEIDVYPAGTYADGSDIIEATDPIALPAADTEICINIDPQPWRWGIYRTLITYVKVP